VKAFGTGKSVNVGHSSAVVIRTRTSLSPKRVIEGSHDMGISALSEAATISLVHRLVSMFPHGGPGLALFLLRISVAAAFFINVANRTGLSSIRLLLAGAFLISISLAIGFLTPFLSVIACVSAVANTLIGPHSGALIDVFSLLDAAALALLGPGAYSVDARLFGRRVIVVPLHTDRK